jgi:non-ribosomal peptide synthase protein (TIGR01720 family)
LPDYMIPSAFMRLAAFPLTPNGKVDQRALPEVDLSVQLKRSYVAPRNQTEKELCRIWQELLKVELIGIEDNFFTLGGDSILSIQVISRANQAGIQISTRQLFEHQTIAALSQQCGQAGQRETPQEAMQGEQKLLPIQRMFLESAGEGKHHYNQSVLLKPPADLDATTLRSIIEALYRRHDVLRMRLTRGDRHWQGSYQESNVAMIAQSHVQETLPEEDQADYIKERCAYHQGSLDIEHGPLWKAVHFTGQGGDRLFLVIHHLVVDGVSWRILLADLEQAYQQSRKGQVIALEAKSSSYQQWGQAIEDYADGEELEQERHYWLSQYRQKAGDLPTEKESTGTPTYCSTEKVELSWSKEETKALLSQCAGAYRTQINELLLSGVYLGLRKWSREPGLRITLEGHGREDLFEQLDLTQTVGWFTSTYPLTLHSESDTVSAVIKAVKEQYRSVPRHGIGYGILRQIRRDEELEAAETASPTALIFNYLGQFDQSLNAETAFQAASEETGEAMSSETIRQHRLGLNGMVAGGVLRLRLDYSREQHTEQTMREVARYLEDGLREVIAHCLEVEFGDYTPSDFPLAKVDQAQLDQWQRSYAIEKLYPATSMQQGLLFHSLLDSRAYVIQTYPTFEGKLSVEHFRHAWQSVVERHDIFRTIFVGEGGILHQLVVPSAVMPWHEEDWRALSESEQATRFERYRLEDRARGFDFKQAPLQRVSLFRLGEERYQMLWSHHHMLLDGWCSPLVYRDVMLSYQAYVAGESVVLPAAPEYARYIGWLQEQNQEEARSYWHAYLAPLEAPTPLSVDKLPPDGCTGYQDQYMALSQEQSARLQAFAKHHQTTLNTLVQLAWGYLLHRYSGEAHVMFGATISGRPAGVSGIESMVGLFINTIPVKVSFDASEEVASLLVTLHGEFQRSNEYGYLPLTEIHKQSAVAGGVRLFDSLVIFENYPLDAAMEVDTRQTASSLKIVDVGVEEHTNYPLTLSVSAQETLKLRCGYLGEEFAQQTISRLLGHLRQVLLQLPEGGSIKEIDLLTEQEHAQFLSWNQTELDYPRDKCVHELIEAQVEKTPEAIAVVYGEDSLTYRELNARANYLANKLQSLGVKQGAFVGLSVERSLDMVVGLLAIVKSGGAYVPLDPGYPKARIAYMVRDSQISVVVTQQHVETSFDYAGLTRVVVDNAETKDQTDGFTSVDNPITYGAADTRPVYMIYTSGSTGQPKGVMVSHRNVVNFIHAMSDVLTHDNGVWVAVTSLSFDISVLEIFGSLSAGFKVIIAPDQRNATSNDSDAERTSKHDLGLSSLQHSTQLNALESVSSNVEIHAVGKKYSGEISICSLIEKHQATHFQCTPSLASALLDNKSEAQKLAALEYMLVGGESLPESMPRSIREVSSAAIYNVYGPTEATVWATRCIIESPDESISIGKPLANYHIYVVAKDLKPLPVGVPGELLIAGDGIALGYFNKPELTSERFVESDIGNRRNCRLYRTGDLAYYLPDGNIKHLRRLDDQIKLRGFRIELGEIENHLLALEECREAVVMVIGENASARLVAFVILSAAENELADVQTTTQRMRKKLGNRIPAHMLPSQFVFCEKFPLTPNKKIDKRALCLLGAVDTQDEEIVAPITPTEVKMAGIWMRLLKIPRVSRIGNFFSLGGHSLSLMHLLAEIKNQFGIEISIREAFKYKDLADMAGGIDRSILLIQDRNRFEKLTQDTNQSIQEIII